MKLKKSSMDQAEAAGQTGGVFISARLRNPTEGLPVRSSEPGDKVGMICAIIVTLILVAVVAMLYMNWDLIKTV